MDEFMWYNKHYIKTDEQGLIIEGWSDGPHPGKSTEGAICINDKGGYQFRLVIGGVETEENPTMFDANTIIPLYKYVDGAVQKRSEEEIMADRKAIEDARAEEEAKINAIKARQEVMQEAQAVFITSQINTLAVDDATAIRWKVLYPEWSPDSVEYKTDNKVQRGDKLYKCRQPHTSQASWSPELAASLWAEINETHAGTADDPIPYSGNMALESGKFYSQGGVTYYCNRDTGIPVYNELKDLVGLYVVIANG